MQSNNRIIYCVYDIYTESNIYPERIQLTASTLSFIYMLFILFDWKVQLKSQSFHSISKMIALLFF